MSDRKTNKHRRKILQKAGVAGGAAAVTAWTKPSLNAIVSPAHAQMSEEVMVMPLGGQTSTSPDIVLNNSSKQSIASKALNTLVPKAHAGADGPFEFPCPAFTENGADDNTHCIALTFDEAAPDTAFTLDLTGPDVYYGYCFYSGTEVYYAGFVNFSGMASGSLDGQDFTVTIGNVELTGTVDDEFESAAGFIRLSGGLDENIGSFPGGNFARCNTGYGAYWNVALDGSSCNPGSGVSTPNTLVVDASYCAEN